MEYGLFNDEGCVESGFYDMIEASIGIQKYSLDDCLHISGICPQHEEQEVEFCEICNGDEEN